jgi:two-component system phosphate regulon sensor histidine kinase PhoR
LQLDNHNTRPEVILARKHGQGWSRRHSDSLGSDLLYAAHRLKDGRIIRLAIPIAYEHALEQKLERPMVILGTLIVLIGGLTLIAYLWRDRTRIHALVEVSRSFAAGNFSQQAGLTGRDALAMLGQELNEMGRQLANQRQAIESSRTILDGALGALNEGVAVVDDLDHVLYANAAWRQLAAGGAKVLGLPYYQHFTVLEKTSQQEIKHRRRILLATTLVVDATRRVLVLHDVTEVRRLELARRDFIAAVSHELKTPLTSIAGFSETLLSGALEDPQHARDFVERIQKQAERLSVLVRDVLSLSRLEQGAWEVRPESCDLSRLARIVLEEYQPEAQRLQVTVSLNLLVPIVATTDPELVRQLLGNLISNAIRYNRPQGKVSVTLSTQDSNMILSVADTGIGIPSEHQEHVFERFYRVDSHRSRSTGGTGLGLAIVRQLVQVLGGTISLHSSPEGTTFTITLPLIDPRCRREAV